MNHKQALVTGGNGFIGRTLIKILLRKGYKVTTFDRSNSQKEKGVMAILGDVRSARSVEHAVRGKDIVFHLAGVLGTSELQQNVSGAVKTNILGTVNVFEACSKNGAFVVLVSKPNPWLNVYSITKESSEKFFHLYRREKGLKGVIVKWFSVYGPGQKYKSVQKAVPTFIVNALQNKSLPVYGDGKQTADFVYVADTCEATVNVSENVKAEGEIVEIGTGIETQVLDLAKKILKLTKSSSKIVLYPMRSGEMPKARVYANLKNLRRYVKFKPSVTLDEGLALTIDYYQNLLGIKRLRSD